jgi:glycerol-3-phosphate dehydrogenase (NAD(P)+)
MSLPPLIESAIVLGAGSWGTALANQLAGSGIRVQFWGRDAALMRHLGESRENPKYLPGISLDCSLQMVSNLHELHPADLVLFAVPSKGMQQTAEAFANCKAGREARLLLSCTKGIDATSRLRMSEVLQAQLPQATSAVLTGPNHAEEVARRMATAAVVACDCGDQARAIQKALTQPWMRVYTSSDVVGAEWSAALKNCYAIAAGMASGLGLGDNALAALLTRALAEMTRMVTALGGKPQTCHGLAGVGDLIATCYSDHSRNRRLGQQIGQGRKLAEVLGESCMVAEGVMNSALLREVANQHQVRAPLLDEVNQILHEGKSAAKALQDLLSRDPRAETDETETSA